MWKSRSQLVSRSVCFEDSIRNRTKAANRPEVRWRWRPLEQRCKTGKPRVPRDKYMWCSGKIPRLPHPAVIQLASAAGTARPLPCGVPITPLPFLPKPKTSVEIYLVPYTRRLSHFWVCRGLT